MSPGARRSRAERGSVLMLMPAAMLIVIALAAICLDSAVVFLRQRQASSVAVSVANDLAAAALDEAAFRQTGEFVLDPARAQQLGHALVRASDLGPHVVAAEFRLAGPTVVVVEIEVRAEYIFARAMPGAPDSATVRARAVATTMSGAPG